MDLIINPIFNFWKTNQTGSDEFFFYINDKNILEKEYRLRTKEEDARVEGNRG